MEVQSVSDTVSLTENPGCRCQI